MTRLPRVVLCSMWRNDADRNLAERAQHLLDKGKDYPALRWEWVIGDSDDATADVLGEIVAENDAVSVVVMRTGIEGDDMRSRLRRLSVTANVYLEQVVPGDDYVMIHESDIVSPYDVVRRMVDHAEAGRCPIAGWPVITLPSTAEPQFYDVWAYRASGQMFQSTAPYHAVYRADAPFEVESAGTVLLFDAKDVAHAVMHELAIRDLCAGLRATGRRIWVDPSLVVTQPALLWTLHNVLAVA